MFALLVVPRKYGDHLGAYRLFRLPAATNEKVIDIVFGILVFHQHFVDHADRLAMHGRKLTNQGCKRQAVEYGIGIQH